jgi:rSAM/selenodomain-associated transferase 2
MTGAPVAIVIPVLGDADALDCLLQQLAQLQPRAAEIVVVDGDAGATSRAVCARHGIRHLTARAGRGNQLRVGALATQAPALWFLHADVSVRREALSAIGQALDGGASGGYFRFSFAGPATAWKRVLAALINLRCRIGVPYGDQGLFFARAAYVAAGGFADQPLFEEVRLVRRSRAIGPFVALPMPIGVSPRRWERDGWLRRSLANRWLAFCYTAGVAPDKLARRYRSGRTAE